MAENNWVKAEKVVRQALGMLEREIVLPSLVTRHPGEDFKGTKNDTVSIRVPAYTNARTRELRGGRPITMDNLSETKVDLTLDTDVYKAVPITDEEMTLDITNFGEQVTTPIVHAVARGVEDAVGTEINDAAYANTLEVDNDDPYDTVIDARKYLNNANVPQGGRVLAVGSNLEAKILKSDHLARYDGAGDNTALREARIGRYGGFETVTVNGLDPDVGVAFHRSAFVLAMIAPVIPDGVTWGATESFAGMAMRVIRDYDFLNVQDRLLADVFIGTGTTLDAGSFNSMGKFVPYTEELGSTVTLATSAAADDIIDTTTNHGYSAGDAVVFPTLTGGTGLEANRTYYVIAANLGAQTFQVSETAGGTAVDFFTNITAGTVRSGGNSMLVRAVKLVDNA